jgi:hypothetical protein
MNPKKKLKKNHFDKEKDSFYLPNTIRKWRILKKRPLFTNCKSMGVGPFAYFDQGSFASLNDKI